MSGICFAILVELRVLSGWGEIFMVERLVDNAILGAYALVIQIAVMLPRMLDWRPKAQRVRRGCGDSGEIDCGRRWWGLG